MKIHMEAKHYQGIAHTSRGDAVIQTLVSCVEDALLCPKAPQMSRITWRSTQGWIDEDEFLVLDVELCSEAVVDRRLTRRIV